MNVKGTDAMERLHRRQSVPTVRATVLRRYAVVGRGGGGASDASRLINGKKIKKGKITGTQIKDPPVKEVRPGADAPVAGPEGAARAPGGKGHQRAPGSDGQDGAP